MIGPQEVREFAREVLLDIQVVEKDYVLGWLLAGIAAHPALRDAWVFKGGTCLKKCYFETYRFSEDLDFTVTDADHFRAGFLLDTFDEIGEWVYEQSGVELPREARKFEVFANTRGRPAAEGRVGYRGPQARAGDAPRIKLDLASDEVLALPPVRRTVHHPYSDEPPEGIDALCYAFPEVFAEKLRALSERQRPRDLYDVVHLYRHTELRPDPALVRSTLARKCEHKGIPVPTFAALCDRPERQAIEAEWEQMLAHQLPACPPFAEFWNELPLVFDWLKSGAAPRPLPTIGAAIAPPASGLDLAWHAPAMVTRWGLGTPLEAIRFAGANRLVVDLDYEDERGTRSRRAVEPYALRRTQAGDLLLYAVRDADGETRSYRVDRIRGASVLPRAFAPRFAVELSAGAEPGPGPASTPRAMEAPIAPYSPRGAKGPPSRVKRGLAAASGPTYIYECPMCNRRFARRTRDGRLNAHKTRQGWDCPGRTGIYKDMKF